MKLLLKGILLAITFFFTALFLCSVDSLADNNMIFKGALTVAGLILACYIFISKKDIEELFPFTKED